MDRKKEIETVDIMIGLYCRKKHKSKKDELCQECKDLSEYCHYRLSLCPWKEEEKPFCSNCPIHCYKPEYKQKIREVMRFSGPRMIFHRPILAIKHIVASKSEKKRMQKKLEEKKKAAKK